MKYLLVCVLLAFSLGSFAAIYMQTDPNGNVSYSDAPESSAQTVVLPSSNNTISVPSKAAKPNEPSNQPGSQAGSSSAQAGVANPTGPYSSFQMIIPTDQQTFQNQRDIQVILQVEPNLREGDKVQLYLDGNPSGPASSDLTQLYIRQADRGEHTVSAAIIDSAGNTMDTVNPVTVYIHYSALPNGVNGLAPTGSTNGITPSSPGSGVTPPASQGTGVIPPNGQGIVPPNGNGATPPASNGNGIVPSIKPGTPVY